MSYTQQQRRRQPQQSAQQRRANDQRQKVDAKHAIDTLCAMFENIDRDVVKMVLLESCSGNMETAVEALLIMSGNSDVPLREVRVERQEPRQRQGRAQSQLNRMEAQQRQVQQQQQYANELQQEFVQQQSKALNQNSQPRQRRKKRQGSRHTSANLPEDFLRPPSYFLRKYPNASPVKFDEQSERERQIIEDEIFAKQLFESSLFTSDLAAHPEWVRDRNAAAPQPRKELVRQRAQSDQSGGKFSKIFKRKSSSNASHLSSASRPQPSKSSTPPTIDPSNPLERQKSFRSKFNSLGRGAKERLALFADKLKKHKENKNKPKTTTFNSHKYHSALVSLDDEPLLEDDLGIDSPSEANRGTYVPPKPSQEL